MTKRNLHGYLCPKCGGPLAIGPRAQSGKRRWTCRGGSRGENRPYCYSTTNPDRLERVHARTGNAAKAPRFIRNLRGKKRFLVTAAQNATPVFEPFLESLLQCAKETERELIVIPLRYKNPTSNFPASQRNDEEWAPELQPYLYNQRKRLNENLLVLGDIKTQPTAERPLTGFEGISHGESAILGHTKLQLATVPTPQSRMPKILVTTGAVTIRNYTDSKAGKKGDFHHVFGAAAVDVVGKKFHLRQINARSSDGTFVDLTEEFTPTGVSPAPQPAALTCGDIHVSEAHEGVLRARERLVKELDPEALVFHDVFNGRSLNPHERKNPFVQMALHAAGARDVRAEVEQTIRFIKEYCGRRRKIVVDSNHNNWLARWLYETDWRDDPLNGAFHLETSQAVAQSVRLTPKGPEFIDAFTYWLRQSLAPADMVETPGRSASVMLAGVENGYHGDKGPNGARGSVLNMSKLGVKINMAHVHAPAILGPLFAAGTTTHLDPTYTHGHPGAWLHSDILTYYNGKRTLVTYIDGKYRL